MIRHDLRQYDAREAARMVWELAKSGKLSYPNWPIPFPGRFTHRRVMLRLLFGDDPGDVIEDEGISVTDLYSHIFAHAEGFRAAGWSESVVKEAEMVDLSTCGMPAVSVKALCGDSRPPKSATRWISVLVSRRASETLREAVQRLMRRIKSHAEIKRRLGWQFSATDRAIRSVQTRRCR